MVQSKLRAFQGTTQEAVTVTFNRYDAFLGILHGNTACLKPDHILPFGEFFLVRTTVPAVRPSVQKSILIARKVLKHESTM